MARKTAIEMHSTHNEAKSVVSERFIGNLKNKIYKCITAITRKCVHWQIRWYS